MKAFLERAFVDSRTKMFFVVSDMMAVLTVLSTITIVLETVPSLGAHEELFNTIEWIAVTIFSFEYAARLYVSKPWHKYSRSFFGIIDLVAILPTLLGLGNLVFLKSVRVIRLIRLLRLVKVAKVSKMHMKNAEESLSVFTINIAIYVVLLSSALLIFGTTLYLVESTTAAFVSIPSGMWWSFKVFVGSIPVDAPLTALGAVVYVAARFVGLILLGVLIGVVGNIFRQMISTKSSSR